MIEMIMLLSTSSKLIFHTQKNKKFCRHEACRKSENINTVKSLSSNEHILVAIFIAWSRLPCCTLLSDDPATHCCPENPCVIRSNIILIQIQFQIESTFNTFIIFLSLLTFNNFWSRLK